MSVKIYSSGKLKLVDLQDYEALKEKVESYKKDAELFQYWIKMAAVKPGKVATAIASCLTPEEYREALTKLKDTDQ